MSKNRALICAHMANLLQRVSFCDKLVGRVLDNERISFLNHRGCNELKVRNIAVPEYKIIHEFHNR